MNPTLTRCSQCGRAPTIASPDVAEIPVYYAICKCGRRTHWRLNKDVAIEDWNKEFGADKQPSKATVQLTHAAMVLAHKKGEMAYAG